MGLILSKIKEYGLKKVTGIILFLLCLKSTIGRRLVYTLKKLPPGPIPLPIIGNFPTLSPPNKPPGIHKDFWRLSKKFGPVYSLYFGDNYGIVCNSREAYFEALKTKQDDFANRPQLRSFQAITHGQGVAMNNGSRWRMIRTVLQQKCTSKQHGVDSENLFNAEIQDHLLWLRKKCERGLGAQFNLRQLLRREALNAMMMKLFSFRFEEGSQEYFEVQDFIRIIFEHIAQGSPSDFMPIAKYFPNEEEKNYFKTAIKMENYIDNEIKSHKETYDKADPSKYDFVHAMLSAQKEAQREGKEALTDVDIRVVCWDAMAGGIDTASTTMEWLIYIMINYPRVLKKCQQELDQAVGSDRLPCLDDIPNLKYCTAVINEVLRWKHFAPQGLPHEAAVDTTILGYNVPKGTQVFFNYYSLHMNPEYWDKPEEFRPERFLEEEKDLLDTCLHPETYFTKPESYKFVPFGQGRRRCVGYGIGRIALWLKVVTYLHCFDWKSSDGKPMDLETEILGITMVPAEQKVKAIPRLAAQLLKSLKGKNIETR